MGSRLKTITNNKPKALVEINGITMLETVISNLKTQGVKKFLVNIHHFGDKIIEYLNINNNFGVDIRISDERELLLDTGGAILHAKKFIEGTEPVLIHNVDIISDFSLIDLLSYHREQNCLATLCVRKRDSQRGLLFNNANRLIGWTNLSKNKYKWVDNPSTDYKLLAYSGVYLINPEFAKKINQKLKFSIIDTWLDLAKNNNISGFIDYSNTWFDLGTIEKINEAENKLNINRDKIS